MSPVQWKAALQKTIVLLFNSSQFKVDSIQFNNRVDFAKFTNYAKKNSSAEE